MRTVVYLALTETGSVRAMKSQPRMKAGEAIYLHLVVAVMGGIVASWAVFEGWR